MPTKSPACVPTQNRLTPILHGDILKAYYSEITVVIENQSGTLRKAHLVDTLGISRTYAITRFHSRNWPKAVEQIAITIKQGSSIGETFRNHGYTIYKRPICTHEVRLSSRLQKRFSTTTDTSIAHQYIFTVSKNGYREVDFATITEIYPPELSDILIREQIVALTSYDIPHCTHKPDDIPVY